MPREPEPDGIIWVAAAARRLFHAIIAHAKLGPERRGALKTQQQRWPQAMGGCQQCVGRFPSFDLQPSLEFQEPWEGERSSHSHACKPQLQLQLSCFVRNLHIIFWRQMPVGQMKSEWTGSLVVEDIEEGAGEGHDVR